MDEREKADIPGLIARAQAGEKEALEEMVRLNLNLVRSLLRRFSAWQRDREELYQQGLMGLVKAVRRFDLTAGVQFSTYAVPVILGEIRRFLRDDSPVHLGRTGRERAAMALRAENRLRATLHREPTIPEIAAVLRMLPAELVLLMETGRRPVSLDSSPDPNAPRPLLWGDILMDPRGDAWIDRLMLRDLIARLPKAEQWLLYLRFAADKTQTETAALLNMTQVQVSRLEARIRVCLKEQWIDAG